MVPQSAFNLHLSSLCIREPSQGCFIINNVQFTYSSKKRLLYNRAKGQKEKKRLFVRRENICIFGKLNLKPKRHMLSFNLLRRVLFPSMTVSNYPWEVFKDIFLLDCFYFITYSKNLKIFAKIFKS